MKQQHITSLKCFLKHAEIIHYFCNEYFFNSLEYFNTSTIRILQYFNISILTVLKYTIIIVSFIFQNRVSLQGQLDEIHETDSFSLLSSDR